MRVFLTSNGRYEIILRLLAVGELDEAGDTLDCCLHVEVMAAHARGESLTLDLALLQKLVRHFTSHPVVLAVHEGDRNLELGQETTQGFHSESHRGEQMIDAQLGRLLPHAYLDDPLDEKVAFLVCCKSARSYPAHDATAHHFLRSIVAKHTVSVSWGKRVCLPIVLDPFGAVPRYTRLSLRYEVFVLKVGRLFRDTN